MTYGVTVIVPTVPQRAAYLPRALASVAKQTFLPERIIVEYDHAWDGVMITRNRALARVDTDLVAFLDDDDEMKPDHLELLQEEQAVTGADLVYPWYETEGHLDNYDTMFGQEYRPGIRVPIAWVAKVDALRKIGGFQMSGGPYRDEDIYTVQLLHSNGYKVHHLAQKTWIWHHHGQRTGGGKKL